MKNYDATLAKADALLVSKGVLVKPDLWRKVEEWLKSRKSRRSAAQVAHCYLEFLAQTIYNGERS